ncbi:KH domain-containing protein [Candidatus Kaiserbacteria bacterium]|nr:KH domain-containing protein [Candidatus Kaiserbacteria bacterium]
MADTERDQQFLEYVIKALVDKPEGVKIERTVDEMGVLLRLSVDKDDMGKVIGRSGATAKAIRTILRVVGMKNDARVNLKIDEPEGGMRSQQGGPIDMGDPEDVGTMADVEPKERTAHIRQEKSLDDVLDSLK